MTADVLDGIFKPIPETLSYQHDSGLNVQFNPTITINMLNRRPHMKEELMEELKDIFVPWDHVHDPEGDDVPEPDDFQDEQLLNALNCDPQTQATVLEALLELDDCEEAEGEPYYRPSILDTDIINPLEKYREEVDEVPFKYDHLSDESLDKIYSDPQIRYMLAKMEKEHITDALVMKMVRKV